jgi:hypothetical protein
MGARPGVALLVLLVGPFAGLFFGSAAAAASTPTPTATPTSTTTPANGGFTVRPAHSDPSDPITQAYFKPTIGAGGTFSDQIIVGNISDRPMNFIVSSVDGVTGETSGAVYANRQDRPTRAGSWATVDQSTLSAAPHQEQTVAFTVHVPAGTPAGDHLLGLAVEDAQAATSSGSFQVRQVLRVVVGVLIRVPGPAPMHLRIGRARLQPLGGVGTAAVIVTLSADGQSLCKPALSLTVATPDGAQSTQTRQLDTLLPGDTIQYPFPWPDDMAAGTYQMAAVATGCGQTARWHGSAVLGAKLRGTGLPAAPRPVVAGSSPSLWVLALIVVTSVAAIIGGLRVTGLITFRPSVELARD